MSRNIGKAFSSKAKARKAARGALLAALGAATAVSFSACLDQNVPEAVYGPPSAFGPAQNIEQPSGGEFDPSENVPETVYGPPEWFEGETGGDPVETPDPAPEGGGASTGGETQTQGGEVNAGAETAPEGGSFSPSENIPEPAYGPPEWYQNDKDGSGGTQIVKPPAPPAPPSDQNNGGETPDPGNTDPAFEPENNVPSLVYGPPGWFGGEGDAQDPNGGENFDPSENIEPDVYGPPEWFSGEDAPEPDDGNFDPDTNIPAPVYGPPEWFENGRDEEERRQDGGGENQNGDFSDAGKSGGEEQNGNDSDPDTVPFDPSENIIRPVYGPPEDIALTPAPVFRPDENLQICVYGPPEWFEKDSGSGTAAPMTPPTEDGTGGTAGN